MSGSRRLIAALFAAAAIASAQAPAPAFEVASVKTVQDTKTWAIRQASQQRYRSLSNVMQLVTWAWKVKNYQVLSPLTCLRQDRFEIQATTAKASTDDQFRLMVQTLLADRFHLRLHRETRELPVYVLVTGKNGPKLTVTDLSNEGPQTPPRGINIGPTGMSSRNGTMDSLADILTTNLDRPVLDKTNLTGHYDFTLTWDQPPALAGSSIRAPIGPAIFAPIQSLGLRLEDQEAPVEMLVIDSIDHPSEN